MSTEDNRNTDNDRWRRTAFQSILEQIIAGTLIVTLIGGIGAIVNLINDHQAGINWNQLGQLGIAVAASIAGVMLIFFFVIIIRRRGRSSTGTRQIAGTIETAYVDALRNHESAFRL
jgi:preprotein translocase subunit YajC